VRGRGAVVGEPSLVFVDELEVRITRKNMKNLRIRVVAPDGHIEASVPARMPLAQVERFIRGKRDWVARQQAQLRTSVQVEAEQADPDEVAQWRALVETLVPLLVRKWEPIMGVHAGKLAYRNMKSRWGSCQPSTGRICINVRLALYPPQCLEYVVVHELCHLIEPWHGERFWRLMSTFLPTWKESRDLLKY
jgi:predicted metal-dependent hydrolase